MANKKRAIICGVFDLFHKGHLQALLKTKEYCDELAVLVADDLLVKRLKGEKRPIVPASERIKLLRSLRVVDQVFLHSGDEDFFNFIEEFKPHYFVISEPSTLPLWIMEKIAEKAELLNIERDSSISTTDIIKRINRSNK